MVTVTLGNITNPINSVSGAAQVNANNAAITTAFTDALSVNDTSSNTMNVAINMNSNRIMNLPAPGSGTDPVRLQDAPNLFNVPTGSGGTIIGLTANQIPLAAGSTSISGSVGLSDGQILIGQSSGAPTAHTPSGDLTMTDQGVVTVSKVNGSSLGTFATQNFATPPAIGGTTPAAGSFTTLSSTSTLTASGNTTVSNGSLTSGTTGTHAGTLVLAGSSTGSVTLQPSSSTPTGTVSIPGATGTLLSTAGQAKTVTPTNPTGTVSTGGVMMGIGNTCTITPTYSTRLYVVLTGNMGNSANTSSSAGTLKFGTGAAPSNGGAITGTSIGTTLSVSISSANFSYPFTMAGVVTGLTPGTAYWFDVTLNTNTGTNTASISNLAFTAYEI